MIRFPNLALYLLATSACAPTVLDQPDPNVCDPETANNRWPHFEGDAPAAASTGFNVGDTAPNFSLVDQFGEPVCLWQFSGKVVLIDASAQWCAPCMDMATTAACIADSYDEELVYLTVVTQNHSGRPATNATAESWSSAHSLGSGGLTPVMDDGAESFAQPERWIPSYPSFLLLDRNMTIVTKDTGRLGRAAALAKATELIGEPSQDCDTE